MMKKLLLIATIALVMVIASSGLAFAAPGTIDPGNEIDLLIVTEADVKDNPGATSINVVIFWSGQIGPLGVDAEAIVTKAPAN